MTAELDAPHRTDLASRDGRQRPGRTADRVRVELVPDAGLGRLQLWGVPSPSRRAALGLRWWNLPAARDAARQVRSCCASTAWAAALADERPVADVDVLCAASARILQGLARQLAEITGLRLRRLWCEGET
jgi:hypothetical protein